MERRRESRIHLREQVSVTDLTTQITLDPSEILDYSGRGMALLVSRDVPLNTAVQIDWQGVTLLGYVCHLQALNERHFRIGLRLDHVLSFGRDVGQLLQQLREEIAALVAVPEP